MQITKNARELTDIDIQEVSLVDKAANKKKFLFFKAAGEDAPARSKSKTKKLKKKINIVIDSNGTIGGTKISVNGEEIPNLRDFNFSFWGDSDDSRSVSCSYSKFVETEDGFSRSETFYLSKGDSKMKLNEEIQKQLEAYYGEGVAIEIDKISDTDVIVKAFGTINEYRSDFPDDLRDAIRHIVKQAAQFVPVVVAEEEEGAEPVKKAGAKLSKDTLKKLTDAMNTLKSLLPQLAEKSDTSDTEGVAKMLADITKKLTDLESKEATGEATDLAKSLSEIGKRLESIEKGTNGKTGIDGQDEEELDNAGNVVVKKDGDIKWPSFSVS